MKQGKRKRKGKILIENKKIQELKVYRNWGKRNRKLRKAAERKASRKKHIFFTLIIFYHEFRRSSAYFFLPICVRFGLSLYSIILHP